MDPLSGKRQLGLFLLPLAVTPRPTPGPLYRPVLPEPAVDTVRHDGSPLFKSTLVRVGDGVYSCDYDLQRTLFDFRLDPQSTGEAATYFPPFIRVILDRSYPEIKNLNLKQLLRKIRETLVSGRTYAYCEQRIRGMQIFYESHAFDGFPAFRPVKIHVEQSGQAVNLLLSPRDRSALLGCHVPGDGLRERVFGIDITMDSLGRPRYRLTWLANTFARVSFGDKQECSFDPDNYTDDCVIFWVDDPFRHSHHSQVYDRRAAHRPWSEWGLTSQQIYIEPGTPYRLCLADRRRLDYDMDHPIVMTFPPILPVPRVEV